MGAVYTGKGTIPVQWLLIYYIYLDIAIDKNPEKKQKSCVSHFRLMFQCLIKAMLEKVICWLKIQSLMMTSNIFKVKDSSKIKQYMNILKTEEEL